MSRFAAFLLLLLSASALADDVRRPLDLPSGGRGSTSDEEEDAPEVIEFYGGSYEGDSFMFVIDTSGSMWGDRLATAKAELTQALMSLSSNAEFGIVSFNSVVTQFKMTMSPADQPNKTAAAGWIASLSASNSTCIDYGVVRGLQIINSSQRNPADKRLILLGDGTQACPSVFFADLNQVLGVIRDSNWQSIRIDTILIDALWDEAVLLFELIAQEHGGTFRLIQ